MRLVNFDVASNHLVYIFGGYISRIFLKAAIVYGMRTIATHK